MVSDRYQIVKLANGAYSLRSEVYGETFHPVIGPEAEAKALYVDQLGLVERVRSASAEFVIWDVGLGAAANPITFLNAIGHVSATVRIVSFDYTTEPLLTALENTRVLAYLQGWESAMQHLVENGSHCLERGSLQVHWEFHRGDFPLLLKAPDLRTIPRPHAIFYDAFSPKTNPTMWTLEVFTDLFRSLDPQRPCVMPTYSRSTMLRVTLLLAGFYVGRGHATGEKEETTIASNSLGYLPEPLDRAWLLRCKRSRSAEPLKGGVYIQSPIEEITWEKLLAHPQFA